MVDLPLVALSGPPAEGLPEDPDSSRPRAWEEVLRQARRLHRPEEDPAQAHPEDQQAQAEEAEVELVHKLVGSVVGQN